MGYHVPRMKIELAKWIVNLHGTHGMRINAATRRQVKYVQWWLFVVVCLWWLLWLGQSELTCVCVCSFLFLCLLQKKTRSVTTPTNQITVTPKNGGLACPPDEEADCGTNPCIYTWEPWSA